MKNDEVLLKIKNITVSFRKFTALKNISLNITRADGVIGLIGPNGAGKTTLIHSILRLNKHVKGQIDSFSTKIAYCPDTPEFPTDLTAIEVLYYSAWIAQRPKPSLQALTDLLSLVGLLEHKNNIATSFSRGMKQRLGIAAALILEPELLFLDEPTSALDPFGREEILDIIKGISKDITVVISTHNLNDIQKVANKLIVLNKGELLYTGNLDDFLGADELSFVELYDAKEIKNFIDIFAKHGIKVLDLDSQTNESVITFAHADFPKVLALIDEKMAPCVKVCCDKEVNLYTAFYNAVQNNERNVTHDQI